MISPQSRRVTTLKIAVFCLVFLAVLFFLMIPAPHLVEEGKVNLTSEDFQNKATIPLDGSWEFYWDKLSITDTQDGIEEIPSIDTYINVPGTWKGQGKDFVSDEQSLLLDGYPDQGVATYRLMLRYPKTIEDPILKISHIVNAYTVYVNGNKVDSLGVVSRNPEAYRSDFDHRFIPLPHTDQPVEIVLEVANLDYTRGGIRKSILIGSTSAIERLDDKILGVQLLVIGGTFLIGLYYILLFLMNPKNWTAMFFFFVCLTNTLRASVWGEIPLRMLFPGLSIDVGVFLNYIAGYNTLPTIILFLASLYPLEFTKKLVLAIILPVIPFEALLLTPASFYSQFNGIYYILFALQMALTLILLIRSVAKGRDNAYLMLVTIGILYLTLFNDILGTNNVDRFNLNYLSLYGNLAILFSMAYIQVKRDKDEQKLRESVLETKLAFLQAQIKPHFLYNALSAIANVAEQDGKRGSNLILDLAVYLRNSLAFNQMTRLTPIEKELEFVETYFRIEQARFGEKIHLVLIVEVPPTTEVPILVLQPLVENAVRHGISCRKEGGTVEVRVAQSNTSAVDTILVSVKDDGVGLDKETMDRIFEAPSEGKSVGLYNIHQRLLYLYGKGLRLQSELGKGTEVTFELTERKENNDTRHRHR